MTQPHDPRQGPWAPPHQPGPYPQQPGPYPQQQGPYPQQPGPYPPQVQHPPQAPWPGHPPPPQGWSQPHVGSPPWTPHVRPPQYEFTKEENEVLDDLAVWAGGLGIVKFVQAGLGLIGRNVLGAAMELAVGLSLMGARKALRSAVQTQGNDIDHLMVTIDKLSTVFLLRLILMLVIAAILGLAVGVIVLLVATGVAIDLSDLGG